MRKALGSLFVWSVCALAGLPGASQAGFPDKPIRFVLGFAAGGPADLSVRALAVIGARRLGQPMAVGNLTGADGGLAMAELARAPADGYTIVMTTSSYKAMTAHARKPDFDPDEVRTLLGYAQFRHLLFVKADSPWGTIDHLIAYGRANPGALKFGHLGAGAPQHLQGWLFFRASGVRVTEAPYAGSAELANAVLGGQADMAFADIAGLRALARAGLVRPLLAVTAQRFEEFPELPTALERGTQGPELFNPALGIAYRRGTPPERVKLLHDALRRAVEDPEFAAALRHIGVEGGYVAPEAFDAVVARAEALAVPLLKELKLSAR